MFYPLLKRELRAVSDLYAGAVKVWMRSRDKGVADKSNLDSHRKWLMAILFVMTIVTRIAAADEMKDK